MEAHEVSWIRKEDLHAHKCFRYSQIWMACNDYYFLTEMSISILKVLMFKKPEDREVQKNWKAEKF